MLKKTKFVCLALGTNLGNRLINLQSAVREISEFFAIKTVSHIIETKAMLLENSPASWDIPFFNMVITGTTSCNPYELLSKTQSVEKKLGRGIHEKWSPRIIDIDIVSYYDQEINADCLTLPHKGVKDRDFLQYLLTEAGYEIPEAIKLDVGNYSCINHLVLNPRFVGIVNVTPDSFSDGGCFFESEKAEQQIRKLYNDGATVIDIGAQSTRPEYVEVSSSEEISRLSEVLERCGDIDSISIDTYYDDVVRYVIQKPNIKWINDQNSKLNPETIKLIADKDLKLVTMLRGTDFSWFKNRIDELEKLGMGRENIILDPGIGFGKTKRQNIEIIKNIKTLMDENFKIMLGHSRKSFISYFSNEQAKDRDIETIAISSSITDLGIDYFRVHNVKDHMRFFVAKHCIENS